MENRFKQMREELDSLGYFQKLVPESMPLVQKLLLDLYKTSENLQKYMKISQCALEERDLLESGVEPYKCDNARLIKECNELHQAFIHFKEQHEKNQKDLRHQIVVLQDKLDNCYSEKTKLINHIQDLEKAKVQKGPKVGKAKNDISSNKGPHKGPLLTKSCSPAEEKVKDLEEKHLRLTQENTYLKNQVETRDKEVERLHLLLEGGRPYEAVTKDCCYKNIDNQMTSLQDEITRLNAERNNLQAQLKEAVAKQHEAMRRALHLVERNRQLEKEMKNVDEIALAVEAECKSTVRGNSEKVIRLQDRINESLILIQNLERDKRKLAADLDSVMLEKSHLEGQLQSEQDANKKLTDRINCLVIIENDLNLEIDRLTQLNAKQKRNIMELESRKTGTFHREDLCERVNMKTTKRSLGDTMEDDVLNKKGGIELTNLKSGHKKDCKKSSVSKSPTKNPSVQDKNEGSTYQPETGPKCCCESGNCIKNLRDLLDREVEFRQVHAKQSVEDLRQEKEYYMKEYQRLMEQMRNVPRFETSGNEIMQLKQQLNDKEHQINQLEENLRRFKIRNSEYIINGIQLPDSQRSVCSNINCKNKERELEVKSKELNNLEIENNSLKTKLQAINESTVFNEERIKRAFKEMQEHIQKLEDERRDLVKADLTQRSNISELENHYRSVKDQHKQTQMELNNLRANYNQLKLLQEQNDRALTEAQAHVLRAETDLAGYKSKIKESSNDTLLQDREIARLTSDIQIMKNQLIRLDKEKDSLANNLDEKTEKIASLEDDLGEKTKLIARLETELKDLNRKLSKRANETSSQDQLLRAKEQEIASLEQDHEKEKRLKEAALVENKRLQNDLSSVVCDCREARNELDITKRQVEDLKRQLQHYVAEIKRTEDLISQKELERSELLDQFKSLSQEANELESNNHTLETEATQSKIQLSVALDHTSDLERKIQHQESVIKSYEKQIAESSENVARLEMQLKQNGMELEHCSSELKQMRDLCVKLDREKDVLKSELTNREDRRSQAQKITEKLSSEKETLQKVLEQEKTSLEMVEKLLSDTRRDLTEQRLLNQDMQREISRLKQNISELEERLSVLKAFIKPPERASYIVSTETLASKYQGVSETPSIPNLNTRLIPGIATSQSKPDKAKPVQSSEDVAPINIILSTKSLIPDHTCQPSGTKRDRIIDLTKHDQDNRECLEKCDKMQCPMYKKLFFTQNYMEMDACPRVGFQEESGKGAKIKELVKTASEKKQAKQKRKLVKIPMDSGQLIHEDNASAAEMTSKNDDFYLGSTKQKLEGIGWRECEKILSIDDHDKDNRCRSSKLDYAGLPPRLEKNGDKRSSKPSNVYSCYGNGTEKFQANVCPGLDDSINYRTMNTGRYLCFPHKCSEKPLANILTQGTEFSANQDAKQVGPKCQSCPYISVSEPDIQKSSQKSNARKEEYSKRTTQLPPDIKNFQPNHGKTTATDTTGRNNSKDGIFCWKKSLENSSPARFKRNDVSAQFGHDDDSSAMFRKVFAVNGVGLECQCCISSFTYSKEK